MDLGLEPDAVAVITHAAEGEYHATTSHCPVEQGGGWGMLWGLLFGLSFFVPVCGVAVGLDLGGVLGKIEKSGVNRAFQQQVRDMVTPGSSALFMLVSGTDPERALALLSSFGGQVVEVPLSDESTLAVCDQMRRYRPDIVITHWSGSWHKDHQNCHAIVRDAVFYAGLPSLVRERPAHTVRKLYFAENWEDAANFQADTYLDISAVYDHWVEACAQFPMWRGETGFRYNDYYRSLAVARGCLGGYQYAVALMSSPGQREARVRSL